MGLGVDVLIDRHTRCVECCGLDGVGQFGAGGLHAGRVETAADGQTQGAFGSGSFHLLAGGVNGGDFARDDNLAGTVVVGADNDAVVDGGAELLDLLVGQSEHGGHCRGILLAGFLHCVGAGRDKTQTVLKIHCAGGYESRKFAQRVSGHHGGVKLVAHGLGQNDRVKEDGGLGHLCLFEVFGCTFKHDVGYLEAKDVVGFVKHLFCYGIVLIEVFAHAGEL